VASRNLHSENDPAHVALGLDLMGQLRRQGEHVPGAGSWWAMRGFDVPTSRGKIHHLPIAYQFSEGLRFQLNYTLISSLRRP